MANHVILDNVAHKDLTVKQHYSADYGHNVGATIIFSTELADIQREYPIMLHKDSESGRYHAVAMLGLAPNENLFLQAEGQGWRANYVPSIIAKGPFLIGYEDQTAEGGDANTPVIHLDMDDPRVGADDGRPVFMPHGGSTDYLNSVSDVLNAIEQGSQIDQVMFALFDELNLIEPLAMDIELADGEKIHIEGHYTVDHERFNDLSADEVYKLHQSGFLTGACLIMNSLDNVNRLIALKNETLVAS